MSNAQMMSKLRKERRLSSPCTKQVGSNLNMTCKLRLATIYKADAQKCLCADIDTRYSAHRPLPMQKHFVKSSFTL